MAPGAQSLTEFVDTRLGQPQTSHLSVEERRLRLRTSNQHIKGSISQPTQRHTLPYQSNFNGSTMNQLEQPVTSFEENRRQYYHNGDRFDTDTEHLDDSTIDSLGDSLAYNARVQGTAFHDLTQSPAPGERMEASEMAGGEGDWQSSASVPVKVEPAASQPVQFTDAALQGNGTNEWTNTKRTMVLGRNASGSLNASAPKAAKEFHHYQYPPQLNFRQSMMGIQGQLPVHPTRSTSLRSDESATPPRNSPIQHHDSTLIALDRSNGNQANGDSNGHTPAPSPTSDEQPMTIDEHDEEHDSTEVGQARPVPLFSPRFSHHQHTVSETSHGSVVSRVSSHGDLRGNARSAPAGRFRTKRSHVMPKKRSRSTQCDVDYTPVQLADMNYKQLEEEPFDFEPKVKDVKSSVVQFPDNISTLEQKVEFIRKLPEKESGGPSSSPEDHRSVQEAFFASLAIEEHEESADFIVGQLANMVERLRKLRRAKRKTALEFENEIAKRQTAVSAKMDAMSRELAALKKGGQEALQQVKGQI